MPIRRDAAGNRSVEAQVDVPGSGNAIVNFIHAGGAEKLSEL